MLTRQQHGENLSCQIPTSFSFQIKQILRREFNVNKDANFSFQEYKNITSDNTVFTTEKRQKQKTHQQLV